MNLQVTKSKLQNLEQDVFNCGFIWHQKSFQPFDTISRNHVSIPKIFYFKADQNYRNYLTRNPLKILDNLKTVAGRNGEYVTLESYLNSQKTQNYTVLVTLEPFLLNLWLLVLTVGNFKDEYLSTFQCNLNVVFDIREKTNCYFTTYYIFQATWH